MKPTVLLNIMSDMKSNIHVVVHLARSDLTEAALSEEFHLLIHRQGDHLPFSEDDSSAMSKIVRTVVAFAEKISQKIQNGEAIYLSFHPNLSSIASQKMACCNKISFLKKNIEQSRVTEDTERTERLKLIKHVEFRVRRVIAKTSESIQLLR